MSYTTGAANSWEEVLAALQAAAAAAGWSQSGSIMSKGAAHISLNIFTTTTTTQGPGITLTGGTGVNGAALTGAATSAPRIGQIASLTEPQSWPAMYHIFTFTAPDEVYCIVQSNVEFFHWLAWGVSDVPGFTSSGLWIAGIARRGMLGGSNTNTATPTNVSTGLFLAQSQPGASAVCAGLEGANWSYTGAGAGDFSAALPLGPHLARTPSAWNAAAPLLPIQAWQLRASSKRSLMVDVRNARYIRVDNITPGSIITLGAEQWMVFPWYRKTEHTNTSGNFSGVYGWAIRRA